MKLANALSQRSELQTRIRQLERRLNNNALVQEGEQPAEDQKCYSSSVVQFFSWIVSSSSRSSLDRPSIMSLRRLFL